MPNIVVPNFQYAFLNDESEGLWKLTRAMKAAGWRYKASSDAVTKESGTANPNNDKWGGGTQVGSQTATASFTIGTPTSTKDMGRVTVSGLSGFASTGGLSGFGSIGRFLKITGATNSANNGTWQIVKVNSATSVDVINPAAVAETTPGTATWTELDALLDSIPNNVLNTNGIGAWWNAQGPSTLKIPIGAGAPTANFVRGENVTQDNTGATGEIIGVVTDAGGNGFIVLMPRNSGSGAGQRGWSNTDVIRAANAPSGSGANVTPTGAAIEFITEIVFWKASVNTGHVYIQCIDVVNEGTTLTATNGRFSVMAALGTATTTICPGGATGGSPTTNGFPTTGTFVSQGTGGSGAATTGPMRFTGSSVVSNFSMCHCMVANCIETTGVSADGSFTWAQGSAANAGTGAYTGFAYLRVDDQEEGDVWPYVWVGNVSNDNYNGSTRTVATNVNAGAAATCGDYFRVGTFFAAINYTPWKGWRRRGFSSGDAWQQYQGAVLGAWNNNSVIGAAMNPVSADRVATSFTNPLVKEPIWVVSTQSLQKQRKGTVRWWYMIQGGQSSATFANKTYVQLSTDPSGPVIAGPWDGVSVPYNS